MTPADPLPVGGVLRNRFELIDVIGRGGGSTVYHAVDRIRALVGCGDAEVAIKLASAEQGLETWVLEILHREAGHLRQLRHPNIVQVFDSDRDGPFHFLVLELLRGRTVGRILNTMPRRMLPLDLVLRILEGAVGGLDHAHRRGIVHGDLKPSNVFITLEGQVKLLDFGAARLVVPSPGHDAAAVAYDAITPLYASPELLLGATPSERDDVFALAVLTYVMLAGAHPFDGRTSLEASREGLRPRAPPGLSRRRWAALAQALAFDPRDRIDTVEAFSDRIARPRPLDRWLR